MENASKALIIAGTILVAIMLISISMYFLNSTEAAREEANEQAKSIEIQSFNEPFNAYVGNIINASQIKSLLLLVRSNNAHYEFNDSTPYGTDKYIEVEGINSSNLLYASKTYNVKITEYTQNGYVSKIKIELNP